MLNIKTIDMKSVYYIIFIQLLLLAGLTSCNDDNVLDGLLTEKYVRISKSSITVSVGENLRVTSIYDSEETASMKFKWSIVNPSVATIATRDDNSGIITGVAEGTTVVKVESEDGKLMFFSDLTVQKDRVIKILAIGDSFMEDAVENYLHDLISTQTTNRAIIANLYLDGTSLETNWKNAEAGNTVYELRKIGTNGGMNKETELTFRQGITDENWDYIVLQEANNLAGVAAGYTEYLSKLVGYIRPLATNPEMKLLLHQTWAYGKGSDNPEFDNYDKDQDKMYQAIVSAVSGTKANVDGVIPAGTAIQNGRTSYLKERFTRDGGTNLSLGIGRFTAACTWFESIFGNILNTSFVPSGLSAYDADLAKNAANKAAVAPEQVTVLEDYIYPEPNDFPFEYPIYLDFGWVHSPAPFNNYDNPGAGKVDKLKDAQGEDSGFAIEVASGFSGVLERGMTNTLGLPYEASCDMFFADGNLGVPVSSFVVSNLNRDLKYTFIFFGAINDGSTETEYTVTGKNEGVGYLITDYNASNVAIVQDIVPEEDATITITLRKGPNNTHWAGFYCVNSMIIAPEGYSPF